jgi:LIVCS family branched-chain amino acid:cation transporter
LIGIVTLLYFGLTYKEASPASTGGGMTPLDGFRLGLFEGYQTMDLLAAFFFSATIYAYLQDRLKRAEGKHSLQAVSIFSSMAAAGMLAAVYIGFVYLGSKHGAILEGVNDEQMLTTIAGHTLGAIAIPVAAITMALACLTTATILAMLFGDFLEQDICRGKISNHLAVMITLGISFYVSLFGFDGLKAWIGSVLVVAYPALIVLAIMNIVSRFTPIKISGIAFWLALAISLWCHYGYMLHG